MIMHPDLPISRKIRFLANLDPLKHKATFSVSQLISLQLLSNWIQNEKLMSNLENSERHQKHVDQGSLDVLEGSARKDIQFSSSENKIWGHNSCIFSIEFENKLVLVHKSNSKKSI